MRYDPSVCCTKTSKSATVAFKARRPPAVRYSELRGYFCTRRHDELLLTALILPTIMTVTGTDFLRQGDNSTVYRLGRGLFDCQASPPVAED